MVWGKGKALKAAPPEDAVTAAEGGEGEKDAQQANISQLDNVLKQVLGVISQSQDQFFAIAEEARREYQQVMEDLSAVRQEASTQVSLVDSLEREDKMARAKLLKVSENIKSLSESVVRQAYDDARDARVRLQVAREKEALLRRERDRLEVRLKRLNDTVQRAEHLINKVNMAFKLLSGQLKVLSEQMAGLQQRSDLVFSIIRAQEEERRRVARDVHDGPAQLLANVVFRVEVCQKLMATNQARATEELENLKNLVRQSLQDVRKIIFDLRPMALDDLGLVPAVRGYINGFQEKTGLAVQVRIGGQERRLVVTLEVAIFRLLQEALNNVAKHARAETVSVHMEYLPDQVRVVVEDDGRGFDASATLENQQGEHFGLVGMRERLVLLRGNLDVNSAPGRGTKLTFTIPVIEGE